MPCSPKLIEVWEPESRLDDLLAKSDCRGAAAVATPLLYVIHGASKARLGDACSET
jgi:hypothetical protein